MFTLRVDNEIELNLFLPQQAGELFFLLDSNRHYLRTWLPWVDEILSPQQYQSIISMWLDQFRNRISMNLAIRYRGTLVGSISFNHFDWYNRQTSIGYYIAENAQGKGIVSRAFTAMIQYAFSELGLNRIEVRCGEKNFKSRAIPERLGFTYEGCIRDGENLNGRFHNLYVYSLLAREWKRARVRKV